MTVVPLTPYQVPLPPISGTSDGSIAVLSGRSGRSPCASRHHQARDDLTYLLSINSLTSSPPLLEAVVICLSTTSRPHAAKRVKLESLLLPEGLASSPDDIEDFLLLARYANRYANARGNNITKSMWSEMKVEHYELFYLAGSFAVQNFKETYVDNSTFCSEGSVQNSKSEKNFWIRSGNKSKIVLPR